MTDLNVQTYEGLFLFPQAVAGDLQAASDHVESVIARADGEILSLRKWDERRLAYEIRGNKRGVYFLAFFRAAKDRVAEIERGCNLSEQILRSMITRADHVPTSLIEATEGRRELADEIKLRAEQPAPAVPVGAAAAGEAETREE